MHRYIYYGYLIYKYQYVLEMLKLAYFTTVYTVDTYNAVSNTLYRNTSITPVNPNPPISKPIDEDENDEKNKKDEWILV